MKPYILSILALVLPFLAQTKEIEKMPLSNRYGNKADDYFSELLVTRLKKEGPLDRMMQYDQRQLSARVVLPKGYRKGAPGWGLYLHINSGQSAPFPKEWEQTLAKHKLIYAAPYLVGNQVPSALRMAASLDTMATLQKEYGFDPQRVVVGGLSGGGAVAFELAMNHPERFQGVISHARNIMLKPEKLSPEYIKKIGVKQKWDPRMVFPVEFPYLKDAEFGKIRDEGLKLVFITGSKDFNYEPIMKSRKGWDNSKLPYLIVDQPNMGHRTGSAASLDEALRFIFAE